MNTFWIIYLIGSAICYFILWIDRKYGASSDNTWGSWLICTAISLFLWYLAIIVFLAMGIEYVWNNTKPPKWL